MSNFFSNWQNITDSWESISYCTWDALGDQIVSDIQNENIGYSVVTHDDWVVVGNPSSFRYDLSSSSFWRTGSIDIYKYNTLSNQHDLILTLYKPINGGDFVVLAEDTSSIEIHTDTVKNYWIPILHWWGTPHIHWIQWSLGDLPIEIDAQSYTSTYEDDYGHTIDLYNNVLAVGSRWHNQYINISNKEIFVTGSSVDIYNLTLLNSSPLDGYISTGSVFLSQVVEPPVSESVSGSFGFSVSINDEWLAVGSPNWNNTIGGVHIYRRNSPGNPQNINFSFFQTITGSSNVVGDYFGYSLDLNKATQSYSSSLIVGNGNKTTAGSKAYFFEFDGSNWKEKHIFEADRSLRYLPFYNVNPILRCEDYTIDGYGNSVSLWGDDVAIGAPTDRWIYEYSGSRAYKQGACYLYHRCSDETKGWNLIKKFYGNEKTLKNNKMGFSVDLWDNKCLIGCPKSNVESITSCYIEGSIWQQNYCYANLENYIHGQVILMEKNTSSVDSFDWDVVNVYQRKKRFLSPFRGFGYDVSIADKSFVVGSPLIIYDSNRSFSIKNTASYIGNQKLDLKDITGKAYIYNWNNFRDEFHVGNVFYRNGKIVLNTSGSVFDGVWFNPINEWSYEYEVHFDSKQTLYEKQIVCTVEPGEFNVSTNPTALTLEKATFDINGNGYFDWQDLDIILRYMQNINTRYNAVPSLDWSSSILTEEDEISLYNFKSTNNSYYNTGNDYISQSFFNILNDIGISEFDFNQDSKIDLNDMNIFWKYCSHRLNQSNYKSYITPNSKRKLFSDIIDHLNNKTNRNKLPSIKEEFLTYTSQSNVDTTGSYLAPYVTSIGLYSGLDLVAVAKLGSPIKLGQNFPVNFVVKLDF